MQSNPAVVPRTARANWTFVTMLFVLVFSAALIALPSGARSVQSGKRLATTITEPPEFSSSVESIEVLGVELADGPAGKVVRIRMRNLVDEPVIGLDFEITGADPNSSAGFGELTQLRATPLQYVIDPKGEHVSETGAGNFKPGDKLRLTAALFLSGRGEGDVAVVNEMRRDSATLDPPVPRGAPN
jgi:hypothetical protein